MNRLRSIVLAAAVAGLILASAASAQTISVVSGNGQILSNSNLILQPLVIKVTDSGGSALAGATINWNAFSSNGLSNGIFLATGTNQATTVTDATGLASVFYSLSASTFPSSNFLTAILQTTVSAGVSGGNSVNFTLTQMLSSPSTFFTPSVQASMTNTFSGDVFSGSIGTTGSQTIQVHVAATNGQATNVIPGAAVQLLNYQDPATGPAVVCASADPAAGFGTVLTDFNGNATCNVVFGGQPGRGQFVVTIGGVNSAVVTPAGYWQFSPVDENTPTPVQASWLGPLLRSNVTPGSPGVIRKIGGDSQTVNPGQTLTVPVQVQVDDSSGRPLSGITVNWRVSPAGAANLSNATGTTDFTGRASNGVTISNNASGAVQIIATLAGDATKTVTFTVSVTPPITITAFNIVSGNNQSAAVNTSFSQPLVVQLTTSAGSPAGVTVQFSSSGPIFLSSTTASTDSSGRAQVSASAGSVTGSGTVVASVAGAGSQTFSLSVTPPAPPITAGNFLNGADLNPNSLSPCALGAIVTSPGALGIPDVGPTFPGLPVPSSSVRLTIGNTGAPILNIGANPAGQQQITFQVPCETATGSSVPATLGVGSGSSNVNLAIGAASPGIFQTQYSDGIFRAVAVRPDGSYVSLNNPARRGEQIVAHATGLGPTTPGVGTQGLPQPGSTANVQGTVIVGMAGRAVPLVYARLSENLPGVYVVAFQIPADMSTGSDTSFSMTVQLSGTSYNSGSSRIPVQ